jgi:hypothetical protein
VAKNTIKDLRDHLFETIEALKDDEKPMDIERAKAITQVASAIIESAKVEVKAAEVMGQDKLTDFLDAQPKPRPMLARANNSTR